VDPPYEEWASRRVIKVPLPVLNLRSRGFPVLQSLYLVLLGGLWLPSAPSVLRFSLNPRGFGHEGPDHRMPRRSGLLSCTWTPPERLRPSLAAFLVMACVDRRSSSQSTSRKLPRPTAFLGIETPFFRVHFCECVLKALPFP